MDTKEMLQEITRRLGVDGFGTGEGGRKELVFDDEVVVVFDDEARRDGIWISTEIAPLPKEHREAVLRLVLRANAVAADRHGPVATLEGDRIVLQQFLSDASWTPESVMERLEGFLNRAESLKNRLSEGAERGRSQGGMPDDRFWNGMLRP